MNKSLREGVLLTKPEVALLSSFVIIKSINPIEVATIGSLVNKRRRKRGNNLAKANAPPKVLRKDHATFRPAHSTLGGKSLASMGLDARSTFSTPATHDAPTTAKSVSDPDLLSYAKPQPYPKLDIAQSSKKTATRIPIGNVATTEVQGIFFAESPESGKSTPFPSMDGSPGGIYQPGWGVTNNCHLDTPNVCQDMVDHIVSPRYFFELRHFPNTDFLSQYNINLAWQVAMGSQLRLRFEQEVRLLKKATAKIAKRDQRIQAREEGMKKLDQEIKSLRVVEAEVSNLQAQVTGEEKIKAAFEEFKKYEDDKVKQRSITGYRWVIEYGLRLTVMKFVESSKLRQTFADVVSAGIVKGMSEGLKHGIENRKAGRDLAVVEAYDPEADSKVVYRTHKIGFAHHARSDGILVSMPTITPRGLAILLADVATQIEMADKKDEPHPRLQRSIFLPPSYN
uniref:Transposase (Putative), gypsy type n=1 Tax=Tanacetum cinerariifolium TaxID=118510 RepID=A0A699HU58_TANCI|nr:hypothetical protein [Tanacetum cinerariifolium]